IMHADVIFWPLWCNKQEMWKMEEIRRKWDIGNKAVEFIPYWENKALTSDAKDVCISYYDKKGEKLAIVSNLARTAQKIKIKLPAGTKSVVDAETEKPVAISRGTVTLDMKRNDFGVLIVK
ncbi:MAG: hypothetical protein IKO93_03435, partial [Lentisphaeria bacterium]|nr:hypothetical protein [Lentisphaeria bacterium]